MYLKGKLILTSRFDYSIFKIEQHLPKNLKKDEVICIPTAAYSQGEGNYNWLQPQDLDPFNKIGISYTTLDITKKFNEEKLRKQFSNIKLLIITGGDAFYLLKYMRQCNLGKIIKEKLQEEDFTLLSSSASTIFGDDIEFSELLDSPQKGGLKSFEGLNIIPFRFLPAINCPYFAGITFTTFEENMKNSHHLFGFLEEQCLVIQKNIYEVI